MKGVTDAATTCNAKTRTALPYLPKITTKHTKTERPTHSDCNNHEIPQGRKANHPQVHLQLHSGCSGNGRRSTTSSACQKQATCPTTASLYDNDTSVHDITLDQCQAQDNQDVTLNQNQHIKKRRPPTACLTRGLTT